MKGSPSLAAPQDGWMTRDARALSRPATVAERGVVAPFTAPLLFGVRLRAGGQAGLEVVFPNPSGREGWFVLPWKSAAEAFRPSLADRALMAALGEAQPTPSALRAAARRAAAEGLAGRAARRAAQSPPPDGATQRQRVETFLSEIGLAGRSAATESDRRRCEALRAQGQAAAALAAAQPAACPMGAARREWLLDGWELFAAAWAEAPAAERPALLRHAACLAPPLPLEAESWPGGEALGPEASPRGGGALGAVAQELAEAALARWLAA